MTELPRNGQLLALYRKHGTDQGVANFLGVARTTLRDHVYRLGLREATRAVRDDTPGVTRPVEIPVIHRDYSGERRHYIYPLGDVHKGAKMHRADKWRGWLAYLAGRADASLLGTGDFLNTAIIGSKSDVYDETMTVGEAKRELRGELAELAAQGRIDALAPGNHENRITRATGDCPIRDVADALAVPYVEAAALFVYHVGDFEYEVYLRHGTGNGQSLAQLSKSGAVIRADIYITGHTHRQALTSDDFFVRKANGVARERRMFASSGSFLGYERYAAERGYPPSRIGAPRILLDGERFDFHGSI